MITESLIKNCINGDSKAREELYKIYSPKLFAISLKYSRNYAEAEDNLHDAFLLIFEKIGLYGFKGSFDGWIKKVVINHILQQYRKQSFLSLVHEDVQDDVEVTFDDEISIAFLTKIVQDLPDRYRLVFNLYVFDNYSHQEIAKAIGISIGTSKSNLARARIILKNKIESNTGSKKMPHIK